MRPCRNHRITEQVMVGTHGQLKNLYSKRILKFQAVRIVVFDEADEMLKAGLPLSPNYQSAGSAASTNLPGQRCAGIHCKHAKPAALHASIDPCHSLCSGNC